MCMYTLICIVCLVCGNVYFNPILQLKQTLLSKLKPHMEGQELKRPQITLQFVTSEMTGRQPDEDMLPILMNACPLTFSTVKYFEVS